MDNFELQMSFFFLEFGSGWNLFSTFFKFTLTKISCVWLLWTPWAFWDILTLETLVVWDLNHDTFSLFFLASLEIQSAYDNHRLLILSTGRDKNFSQRFLRARLCGWCQQTSLKGLTWIFCSKHENTRSLWTWSSHTENQESWSSWMRSLCSVWNRLN